MQSLTNVVALQRVWLVVRLPSLADFVAGALWRFALLLPGHVVNDLGESQRVIGLNGLFDRLGHHGSLGHLEVRDHRAIMLIVSRALTVAVHALHKVLRAMDNVKAWRVGRSCFAVRLALLIAAQVAGLEVEQLLVQLRQHRLADLFLGD